MKIDNQNKPYGSTDMSFTNDGSPDGGSVRGYGMRGRDNRFVSTTPDQFAQQLQGVRQQPSQHKKKHSAGFWVAVAIAILCALAALVIALSMFGSGKGARQGDAGQLTNKTQEEIQAELDRTVEEGMFNISVASVVEFEDGTSEGEFRIENVPGNRYLMQVVITLDDTGEEVYRTGIIEPDHHIQKDTLDKDLDPGTYAATAKFLALDPETEEEIGQAAAKISLVVHN
ncbi:hypothetical protein [Adlercreutzia sp. ZJ154]|uniref:hypothetical protein n=1 Tax=Adlercreutzia sp. ZJ154 TaxID=2709790 RepID=UPI0013E9C645|nr:hypothetical protein [Adlercreutzia sp. ZJ154]